MEYRQTHEHKETRGRGLGMCAHARCGVADSSWNVAKRGEEATNRSEDTCKTCEAKNNKAKCVREREGEREGGLSLCCVLGLHTVELLWAAVHARWHASVLDAVILVYRNNRRAYTPDLANLETTAVRTRNNRRAYTPGLANLETPRRSFK